MMPSRPNAVLYHGMPAASSRAEAMRHRYLRAMMAPCGLMSSNKSINYDGPASDYLRPQATGQALSRRGRSGAASSPTGSCGKPAGVEAQAFDVACRAVRHIAPAAHQGRRPRRKDEDDDSGSPADVVYRPGYSTSCTRAYPAPTPTSGPTPEKTRRVYEQPTDEITRTPPFARRTGQEIDDYYGTPTPTAKRCDVRRTPAFSGVSTT
jgi:hypothetical protein